ncbi:unnamed protein product [Ambrosiozyma monospora]|uniref:Unnamed protein product n=1 Tax=Ambrosiozyma monospora TaxID=43982 RepID=A0ACB5TSH2_AMBMO|nr:unnamed protein product [Ambrosiozyma monospora]
MVQFQPSTSSSGGSGAMIMTSEGINFEEPRSNSSGYPQIQPSSPFLFNSILESDETNSDVDSMPLLTQSQATQTQTQTQPQPQTQTQTAFTQSTLTETQSLTQKQDLAFKNHDSDDDSDTMVELWHRLDTSSQVISQDLPKNGKLFGSVLTETKFEDQDATIQEETDGNSRKRLCPERFSSSSLDMVVDTDELEVNPPSSILNFPSSSSGF